MKIIMPETEIIPLTKSGRPDKRYTKPYIRKPETELTKTPSTEPNRIDVTKAFELRFKNKLSFQQIADIFQVSKQAVKERIDKFTKFIPDIDELETYRINKADILEAVQLKHVEALHDPERIKKASLNNVAFAFKEVNNAIRLERDEPTQNIAQQHAIIAHIKTLNP